MNKIRKYVIWGITGIIWTVICFMAWVRAIFAGFPKHNGRLIRMGYSRIYFTLPQIVVAVWIIVPILVWGVFYFWRRRKNRKILKKDK